MKTENIPQMLALGQLALDHWAAQNAAGHAHDRYLARLDKFEAKFGRVDGRLSPDNPAHAAAIAYTAEKFAAYEAAKRAAYNIKRRMQTACRNLSSFAKAAT